MFMCVFVSINGSTRETIDTKRIGWKEGRNMRHRDREKEGRNLKGKEGGGKVS